MSPCGKKEAFCVKSHALKQSEMELREQHHTGCFRIRQGHATGMIALGKIWRFEVSRLRRLFWKEADCVDHG